MIEYSVVHIYTQEAKPKFVGCGALVDGGFIATCRHVWQDAGGGAAGEVRVKFPRYKDDQGVSIFASASLADACAGHPDKDPDLVLLRPKQVPPSAMRLSIARAAPFEEGEGFVIAWLPSKSQEVRVEGNLSHHVGLDGRREFSHANQKKYWLERGSSGSPVFLKGGQQLAGLASLAEQGDEPQTSNLHEAFVVPGTVIWKFVERAVAALIARDAAAPVERFDSLLKFLGEEGVSAHDLPERLEAAIAAMRAHADERPAVSSRGYDVSGTIQAARDAVGNLNTAAALELLKAKRAEISDVRKDAITREVALLREQAVVRRLAKTDPGNAGWRRDLAVSYERLGAIFLRQGKPYEAKSAYQGALEVYEALILRNPGDAPSRLNSVVPLGVWRTSIRKALAVILKRLWRCCDPVPTPVISMR